MTQHLDQSSRFQIFSAMQLTAIPGRGVAAAMRERQRVSWLKQSPMTQRPSETLLHVFKANKAPGRTLRDIP
jgi:hypothetical protein